MRMAEVGDVHVKYVSGLAMDSPTRRANGIVGGRKAVAIRLRFAGLKDGVPGVSAGAAMAPGHRPITLEHVLDADVMVGAAVGTQVRDTGGLHLAR
jgi:hypothetical protein